MTLSQRILRFFSSKTEDQRIVFRMAIACAAAHAEDLNRTACYLIARIKQDEHKPEKIREPL